MKKRIIGFLTALIIVVVSLTGRLLYISASPVAVSEQNCLRVREIASVRGMIYDRNLLPLVNCAYKEKLLIMPTEEAMGTMKKTGADEDTIKALSEGYFLIRDKNPPSNITSSDSIKIIKTYERYAESSLVHIIGYTDDIGNGVCGIEKYYNDSLISQGGKLEAIYSADAEGRILTGEDIEIRNTGYYNSDGIVLTIDTDIQTICENAMEKNNITKGAVVVMDVKTSEILSCVSAPHYDRNNLSEYMDSPDSPFINRAFTAYPVGSVFKVVTSVSAMENSIKLPQFRCTGNITKSENTFNCSNLSGHGIIDFNTALSDSCNPYFIDLGTHIGGEKLLHTAYNLGFGKSSDFGNGYMTDTGTLPQINSLNSDAAVGNFAFGQGELTATPVQIANLFACIGNGGIMNEPSIICGYTDKSGAFSPIGKEQGRRAISQKTCNILKDALIKTATDGTGKYAFSSLYDCCAKTATAQSGQYKENSEEILYCWFAGFFPAENPEYVICIMKEDGVSGGTDCAPVFKEIAEGIIGNSKLQRPN